ncbi:ABC transporter permease [Pseudoalteromonas tunicata]|jgi:putative ABC transport system permease protein|uniref:ABC transporter, permease protein n=1 Tax=Pseudoalteromonas tunicata D2 TaxID=87626 RepID=A4CEC6_9GAMM|nr:ABC transporter permease [Pseudoalteromonas tunicata]ATC93024.1 putative ABC transport system permease protein [Pseudoalteromonas tunicata]AXT32108.1 ABC transporter permease [Pseudoalteromonas tunicata]EAR26938.1 hypothetical protein PTD2_10168 [Pseudoalteromonas tunicata D2]MDP4982742.1 ABC transporter permease [Pseudoalteromonas tunicata]
MNFITLFYDTAAELAQHKLRTFLTLLGMIFGVGAVIAMLNIGKGAEQEALKMIDSMGLYNVIINAKEFDKKELVEQRKHSAGLAIRDGEVSVAALPFVTDFSAQKKVETYHIFSEFGSSDGKAVGVSPNYFQLAHFQLAQGRLLQASDNASFKQVVLLGANTAKQLFPLGDALTQTIKINHLWFEVVGVLADPYLGKNEFQGIKLGTEQDQVFIPLKTAMHRFASTEMASEISSLTLALNKTVDSVVAAQAIEQLFKRRHNEIEDYELVIPAALLAQQKQTQQIFNIVMSCVAGISLLVGGIGIMNIMLATVLERTKEIGLLRAIGATEKDIRIQFIAESFTISILGGLLGVVFGILLSELIAIYSQWAVMWSISAILLSFSICAAIGLIFGVYPAIKASQLDPITALQSD